jgi:hypothetical protein
MIRFLKRYSFILFLIVVILAGGCASSKSNPYYKKKKNADLVNTSNLGRNKYYFSSGYQKKLSKLKKK